MKALVKYIRTMDNDFRRRETSDSLNIDKSTLLNRQIDRMEKDKDASSESFLDTFNSVMTLINAQRIELESLIK